MSARPAPEHGRSRYDRRAFAAHFAALGLSSTLLPGLLWAHAVRGEEITPATIASAEELAGLSFTDDERQLMVKGLQAQEKHIEELHAVALANGVAPAVQFDAVLPGVVLDTKQRRMVRARVSAPAVPADLETLAFLPVTQLAELVRRRKVTATQLTTMYLKRLERYDPVLHCVVTLTEERALAQARAADHDIAHGRYRGPLHGIPWGAKDLLAVKGYPTTWGAKPYESQRIDEDATVVQRLDAAGAILIAKLSLGALAMGDVWFGGMTRNPWKTDQGSSGSSAGPASATSAGLVGFGVGSETLGSISSPSTRCGVTGLRPTFGRVPRTGAMALSWSMDKLGPICRSVEDCALVLDVIRGPDGKDGTVHDAAFNWDATVRPSSLRVGYLKSAFDQTERHRTRPFDDAALGVLRSMGVQLVPVELPDFPWRAMGLILDAEAAAAFDDLTRSGRDKELVQQGEGAWPNTFRVSRFVPAVEYINANRVRTLALEGMRTLMAQLDVIVAPTFGTQLTVTNLTGHPAVIVPNGFAEDGTPVSITFLGDLFGEAKMLALAHAYQQRTGFQEKHPPI